MTTEKSRFVILLAEDEPADAHLVKVRFDPFCHDRFPPFKRIPRYPVPLLSRFFA